ncbi:anthrone oxygenase family protein [Nocardioides sp. NPDC051685]|uniref:anthrone oxygenase family protein n=1 Tax=Nocardioides sp. NPDC051685 TaxID=3364334 RepID=UPI0037B21DF8
MFAGFMVTVLVIELTLRGEGVRTYIVTRQVMLEWLDVLASVTLLPALAALAVLVVGALRWRGERVWPSAAALALLMIVLVISFTFNLPINADQRGWDAMSPPADWASIRDEWQWAHVARTALALTAFGLLCLPFRKRQDG